MHNSLIEDYIKGNIHPDSNEELKSLFLQYPTLKDTIDQLISEESIITSLRDYKDIFSKEYHEREANQLEKILSKINSNNNKFSKTVNLFNWKRYVAVASIVLLIGCSWLLFDHIRIRTQPNLNYSVKAGANKAFITLENGQIISLGKDGVIMKDGIQYKEGETIYQPEINQKDTKVTLSTPRGGQYSVVLSDGTKVWLNADSKIIYPIVFNDMYREVTLVGEGYFEVTKDSKRKFIVNTSRESVEVFGTSFNVNSYPEVSSSSISLVEGSVKVSSINGLLEAYLKPNQQTILSEKGITVQTFNMDDCLAWKNGEFMFNNESLSNVAKKLERWYDIEIEVSPNLRDINIWGSISRYEDFDTVMEVITRVDKRITYEKKERRKIVMK